MSLARVCFGSTRMKNAFVRLFDRRGYGLVSVHIGQGAEDGAGHPQTWF